MDDLLTPEFFFFAVFGSLLAMLLWVIPKHDVHGFEVHNGDTMKFTCVEVIEDGNDLQLAICSTPSECNNICDNARRTFEARAK